MNRKHPRDTHSRFNAVIGFVVGILAIVQIDLLFSTGAAIHRESDTLITTQAGRKVASSSDVPPPSPEQVVDSISKDEAIKLRRDFRRKLVQEINELKDLQKRELKDATNDRKSRRKVFEEQEKLARRKFWEEHPHGPDRREYVHGMVERKKAFYAALKEEEKNQKSSFQAKREELEANQRKRRQEFDAAISRNLRPPQSVWGV